MSKIRFPAFHSLRHMGGLPEEVPWRMKRGAGSSVVGQRRKGKALWKRQLGLSIEKDIPMGGHSRQHCENRIMVFNPTGSLGSCGLQGVKLRGSGH